MLKKVKSEQRLKIGFYNAHKGIQPFSLCDESCCGLFQFEERCRPHLFQRVLVKINFNLAIFPSCKADARKHSLRMYLQVQVWRRNFLNTQQYGWKFIKDDLPPASRQLLNTITYSCTQERQTACSCLKVNIRWFSNLCYL